MANQSQTISRPLAEEVLQKLQQIAFSHVKLFQLGEVTFDELEGRWNWCKEQIERLGYQLLLQRINEYEPVVVAIARKGAPPLPRQGEWKGFCKHCLYTCKYTCCGVLLCDEHWVAHRKELHYD